MEGMAYAPAEPEVPMRRIFATIMATALFLFAGFANSGRAEASVHALAVTPQTIAAYATVIRHMNPQMPVWQSKDLARRVIVNSARWRLDANMLCAIVTVESRWHTHALSRSGAIGLGQLMPGTASMLGVDPHNSGENLSGAAMYLHGLMERFGTNYDLVFAAYNAGPKAVEEFGGIPPFDETQRYVVKVNSAWQALRAMVRLPAYAFLAVELPRGPDVDYWLDGVKR
jgi:soluble lytic murein transglycosylase-like protein